MVMDGGCCKIGAFLPALAKIPIRYSQMIIVPCDMNILRALHGKEKGDSRLTRQIAETRTISIDSRRDM